MFDFLFFMRSRVFPNIQVDQNIQYLEKLPNELILSIIGFLTNEELMKLSIVNNRMLEILLKTRCWTLNQVIKNINYRIGEKQREFNKYVELSLRQNQSYTIWIDSYLSSPIVSDLSLCRDIYEKEVDRLERKKNKITCVLQKYNF